MSSKDSMYGIFTRNVLLKDNSKNQNPRTVLMGQICIIEAILAYKRFEVRLLKDGETWESQLFITTTDNCVLPICKELWQYIAAISSPQARVKFAKNRNLCDRLKSISKEMVVGYAATEVKLGKVKFMGKAKGIGYCVGLELHEKHPSNKCNGSCAGIQYFQCLPGRGIFTTIENIMPIYSPTDTEETPSRPALTDLDICLEHNMSSFVNGSLDKPPREEIVTKYGEYSKTISKPEREEIVTKYGEYPKKMSTPAKNNQRSYNMRNSLSLQNIVDVDVASVNTNNDFDQNTMIQPDRSQLMNSEKLKNKSEMDLHDIIGTSWLGSEPSKPESYANLRKNLDKNDNIKEKYSPLSNRNSTISSNGSLSRSPRNKSLNPISHFVEGTGTLKKSKFYTPDSYIENNVDKSMNKVPIRKVENGKRVIDHSTKEINQAKPTATFYVVEKTKYKDPPTGTTNDLDIGSLVEVDTDVTEQPLYGVIRWLGADSETNFVTVGIELEEEATHLPLTLTDGTHNGERFFKCAPERAFFVPLERCHKDSRFQDGLPTPVHQAAPSEVCECPVVPGVVAPLCMPTEEDVQAVCGKKRGIQGHHNSCYLDVTLFAMFTYTAVFDSLLFRPKNENDIGDYDEVQRVLREEIVNPLRKNLFVSADNVMKLRKLLDRLSSVSGLTSEEKDPEEFLNSLLAQILKAEPFLTLNSGQTAFHYQLFVEKDADLTLPTVQQLFEQSFLTSDIKLKDVPSCLIIQMPRFGKNYKMYPRILPSQLLDVTDVIEGSPRQCIICGKLARWECRECFAECSSTAGLESTAFCLNCLKVAHKHERRQVHKARELAVDPDFLEVEEQFRPPRLFMELFAVICIETSHYVAFVKCGVGHEAPWCFFDSMADRKGEKNGYNIPEMVACPDISRWLSDETACRQLHEEFPHDRHLPEHARRLLCDAYICMYQSSDGMMYR